jgi:hypothetical protein
MTPTKTVAKKGRHYVWPLKPPYELVVPSVTNITGSLPKEWAGPWNAKMVAEFAVKHREDWAGLAADDAIDLLKRSPYRTTDKAARAGKIVHNAIEQYVSGVKHSPPSDKALKNQYLASLAFLKDFKVKPKFAEVTIFSREFEYAGTTDLLGPVTIPAVAGLPKGMKRTGYAVIDYKTGKRIYAEHPVQLNAYSRGDFIAQQDGTETPMPRVDFLIVVRPKKRGGYEAMIYTPDDKRFELFLACKVVQGRDEILEDAQIGRVLTGPDEGIE